MSSVMEEIDHGRRFALRIENRALMDFFRIMKQFCLNLRGRTQNIHTFNDRGFDEAQFLEGAGGRPPVICDFYIYKLQSLYLFEKHAEALKMAEEAGERIDGRAGALIRVEWVFHHALTLCALLQSAGEEDRKRFGEKLEAHRKQLKKWADNCPENFLHKHLLVEAEKAWLEGEAWEAAGLYSHAIEEAGKNHFIQCEALGAELAAKFWKARGNREIARMYLQKARRDYRTWGALGKVERLDAQNPRLFSPRAGDGPAADAGATTRRGLLAPNLDRVLKASRALSGELALDGLLTKTMQSVMENTGAEKGYLILSRDDQWFIEAEAAADAAEVKVLQSIPMESGGLVLLPVSMIHYVIRNGKRLVLNDAAENETFSRDFYILTHKPKSLLCAPLAAGGKLNGILHLENRATEGAFTEERLEALGILSAQAAVSLENARQCNRLRQSEKKHRGIVENAAWGVFQSIPDGPILTANRSFARMFGCETPEEIIGRVSRMEKELFTDPIRRAEFMESLNVEGVVKDFECGMNAGMNAGTNAGTNAVGVGDAGDAGEAGEAGDAGDAGVIDVEINARAVKDVHGKPIFYEGAILDV
ncbi:MAG: GAF domain-containing protein, partial [Desulfobacterales bacterium]|nr:GAF domain-containing protein [Desulfobacterales bacterium]